MRVFLLLILLLVVVAAALAVECPDGAVLEGEPDLVAGYNDRYNGGCDTDPVFGSRPFQPIDGDAFCGVTGWYDVAGEVRRDTDWFTVELPASGALRMVGRADATTYLFVREQDCDAPVMIRSVGLVSHEDRYLNHYGVPNEIIWVWVAPPTHAQPDVGGVSWDYWLRFLAVSPVEEPNWSAVKALFR